MKATRALLWTALLALAASAPSRAAEEAVALPGAAEENAAPAGAAGQAGGADAPPAPKAPTIVELRAGFGGKYKQGAWAPWRVTVIGGPEKALARVTLALFDNDGVKTYVGPPGDAPLQLLPDRESVATIYAKAGTLNEPCEVILDVEGASRPIVRQIDWGDKNAPAMPLSATRKLLVCLGGAPELSDIGSEPQDWDDQRPEYARIRRVEELATRSYGYDGVDVVVLFTSDPQLLRPLTPGSARSTALDAWVRDGGTFVMCVARSAEEMLAPGGPLADFAPGEFQEIVPLRQTTAWEDYAESGEPLSIPAEPDGQPGRLRAPKLKDARGVVEAYEGARSSDLPLVVRAAHGLGEVVFVAADLDREPFKGWAGSSKLWNKLLSRNPEDEVNPSNAQGGVQWFGFHDLGGQLHGALEQFTGVSVPFGLVVVLALIYIALIGPVDYFVLKRFVRRMEWTWVTFPAIVVGFSAFAYFLAYRLKGTDIRTNQVDLIDIDTASGQVRGTMWSMLFSPASDAYNLSVEPRLPTASLSGDAEANAAAPGAESSDANASKKSSVGTSPAFTPTKAEILFSWLGQPGSGFGGLNRHGPSGAGLFQASYIFGPELATLDRLPIPIWSTKGLTARWTTKADGLLTADLSDAGDQALQGSIENHTRLRLDGAVLIYDRWAWPLGAIPPGGVVPFEGRADQQNVDTYFKRYTNVSGTDKAQPYEISGTNADRIMEMMMFYEAAGGAAYTQLGNGFERSLDAAKQLRCGRAVLVGRTQGSGAVILRDGQPMLGPEDRRSTFVRFFIPVEKRRP